MYQNYKPETDRKVDLKARYGQIAVKNALGDGVEIADIAREHLAQSDSSPSNIQQIRLNHFKKALEAFVVVDQKLNHTEPSWYFASALFSGNSQALGRNLARAMDKYLQVAGDSNEAKKNVNSAIKSYKASETNIHVALRENIALHLLAKGTLKQLSRSTTASNSSLPVYKQYAATQAKRKRDKILNPSTFDKHIAEHGYVQDVSFDSAKKLLAQAKEEPSRAITTLRQEVVTMLKNDYAKVRKFFKPSVEAATAEPTKTALQEWFDCVKAATDADAPKRTEALTALAEKTNTLLHYSDRNEILKTMHQMTDMMHNTGTGIENIKLPGAKSTLSRRFGQALSNKMGRHKTHQQTLYLENDAILDAMPEFVTALRAQKEKLYPEMNKTISAPLPAQKFDFNNAKLLLKQEYGGFAQALFKKKKLPQSLNFMNTVFDLGMNDGALKKLNTQLQISTQSKISTLAQTSRAAAYAGIGVGNGISPFITAAAFSINPVLGFLFAIPLVGADMVGMIIGGATGYIGGAALSPLVAIRKHALLRQLMSEDADNNATIDPKKINTPAITESISVWNHTKQWATGSVDTTKTVGGLIKEGGINLTQALATRGREMGAGLQRVGMRRAAVRDYNQQLTQQT